MSRLRSSDIAPVAAAIGQPARAAMLGALLGGQWLTAGELARHAGVAPGTATAHLAALVAAGLVRRREGGRHRYHALAGPDVAAALEALARLLPPATPGAPPRDPADRALRFARTCYDHLAGHVGVLVADAMVARGLVTPSGAEVTAAGEAWLVGLEIDAATLRHARRAPARFCLDWSERRDHLAGAVGSALLDAMLARRWLARVDGTRAVRVTLRGREGLRRVLGVEVGSTA